MQVGLSPTKLLALFNLVEIYPHQQLIIMWTTTIIYDIIIIIAVPIINRKRKRKLPFKLCMPFVGLTLVGLLHPSMAVLYHVNGKLQRAYYNKAVA